jgi:predicted RNase H-like HicB family nuclease
MNDEEGFMKFRVVIEYDQETESYAAYCPELPGCTSAGDTENEVYENIQEAITLYFEPVPLKPESYQKIVEVEVSFNEPAATA